MQNLFSRFGRKKALLFSIFPHIAGWILIATANSVAQLLVARFVGGVALSICYTLIPIYCGETAEVKKKKKLWSFKYKIHIKLNFHLCIFDALFSDKHKRNFRIIFAIVRNCRSSLLLLRWTLRILHGVLDSMWRVAYYIWHFFPLHARVALLSSQQRKKSWSCRIFSQIER